MSQIHDIQSQLDHCPRSHSSVICRRRKRQHLYIICIFINNVDSLLVRVVITYALGSFGQNILRFLTLTATIFIHSRNEEKQRKREKTQEIKAIDEY